jgi:hypothetical protein
MYLVVNDTYASQYFDLKMGCSANYFKIVIKTCLSNKNVHALVDGKKKIAMIKC